MTSMTRAVGRAGAERGVPVIGCVVGVAPESTSRVMGRVVREPVGPTGGALGCVVRVAPDPDARTRGTVVVEGRRPESTLG